MIVQSEFTGDSTVPIVVSCICISRELWILLGYLGGQSPPNHLVVFISVMDYLHQRMYFIKLTVLPMWLLSHTYTQLTLVYLTDQQGQ